MKPQSAIHSVLTDMSESDETTYPAMLKNPSKISKSRYRSRSR